MFLRLHPGTAFRTLLLTMCLQCGWAYYSYFIAAESEPQDTNTTELQRKDWKPRLLICVLVHAREVTFKSGQCRIRLTH